MKHQMVPQLCPDKNTVFTKDQALLWFEKNYPKIKSSTVAAHLIRLSVNNSNRVHFSAKPRDNVFFQIDSRRFRLFDPLNDAVYDGDKKTQKVSDENLSYEEAQSFEEETEETTSSNEFAYEKDLQAYLAKNLEMIEPGLSLYEDEDITGIEFPVGGRFIDILAVDKNNNYVVIELKVARGYD
ncbi:MAG: hypothetical protein JWM96_204, partial [Alphaproteobacteria bacterium]|nr:hypothetical protein [Alphaproteobacteria bacterium]